MFGMVLFVGCVFVIIDKNNNIFDKGVIFVIIGLIVFVIGVMFGYNCGYVINFVRDLGLRLFIVMVGWGVEVFMWVFYLISFRGWILWIYILNKFLVCLFNVFL